MTGKKTFRDMKTGKGHSSGTSGTTVEVARDHIVHETAPEAVAALEALVPRALDSVVDGGTGTTEACL